MAVFMVASAKSSGTDRLNDLLMVDREAAGADYSQT